MIELTLEIIAICSYVIAFLSLLRSGYYLASNSKYGEIYGFLGLLAIASSAFFARMFFEHKFYTEPIDCSKIEVTDNVKGYKIGS